MKPVFVQPSGGDDTQRIQDALDRAHVVLLSGDYNISSTLLVGRPASLTTAPPALIGVNRATLTFTGAAQNDYAIRVVGIAGAGQDTGYARLEGLNVVCNHLCRGVLMSGQTYGGKMSSVMITRPRYVGLDLIDCWASIVENVFIKDAFGFAIRAYRFQSGKINNVRATQWSCYDKDDKGNTAWQAASSDIVKYAMVNGMAAADVEYADYEESWPAIDDTICLKSDGTTAYTTAAASRCAILFDTCNCTNIHGLLCENVYSVDYPNVRFLYPNAIHMTATRFERNRAKSLIEINGTNTPISVESVFGGNIFDSLHVNHGVFVDSVIEPYSQTDEVFKLTGYTSSNVIRNVSANGLTGAILSYVGGNHTNNTVERCTSMSDEVPYTREVSSPTVTYNMMSRAGSVYFGDPATDGTWCIVPSGNDLLMQRRESGSYVTKSTISATP